MRRKFRKLGFLLCLLFVLGGLAQTAWAQQLSVKGVVTDAATQETLPGVNIQVKSTTKGCITDLDGQFVLEGVGKNDVLIVSYIGYKTVEVPVNGRTELKIALGEDTEMLAEVVVIGYGVQKKADLTGSVANVNADKLNTQSNANIGQALQGKIAGVDICGEADAEAVHENEANDYANEKLLEVFEGLFGKSDCE